MGRAPCCDKANVKKGPWSPEEDAKLKDFIHKHGIAGNWISLPQKAGLKRCGKSCRLRWLNYLRPNIKHGEFSEEEDTIICNLYATIGSRWSIIAAQLPGRTDNDIKNYWNTKLKKKLLPPKSLLPPFSFQQYNSLYYTKNPPTPISTPQNFLNYYNSTSNNPCYNPPVGLMDVQYYSDNMLMSVAKEASCSSSDGSCSQISYSGTDQVKQGFMIDDQNTIGINHVVDYNQLQYDETQLHYDLINVCNNSNTNLVSDHESKRQDLDRGVMYYY